MPRVYKPREPKLDYCECGEVKIVKCRVCSTCRIRESRINRKKNRQTILIIKKKRSRSPKGNGRKGIGSWKAGKIPRYEHSEDA